MKKLVEEMLENLSTREVFLFRLACASCGAEFSNKPVRFSKAGVIPPSEEKQIIYNAVYEQEMRSVRQSYVRVTSEHLNYCPICKRLVCNCCFLICDDLDMCKQCAVSLEEDGHPVLPDTIDIAI